MVARGGDAESKKKYKSSQHLGEGGYAVDGDSSTEKSAHSRMNLQQENLFFTHVGALFAKRAANFRRDKKAWMCTTILPSLFVLGGLLIFKYAAQDRNMEPVALKLDDYNDGVSTSPRNPITVNNVGDVFSCQPGICAYSAGNEPFLIDETNEAYVYCGLHSGINPLNETGETCTLSSSTAFMDRISEEGVEIIEIDATDIIEVSDSETPSPFL